MQKVTITSESLGEGKLEFTTWNGRPQLARPIVEAYTRLGSVKPIVQQLKTESILTNSIANVYFSESTIDATKNKVIDFLANIRLIIGKASTWTDEDGFTIYIFRLMDFTYEEKAVNDGILLTLNITSIVDGDE